MTDNAASMRDEELDEPRDLSTQRLAEIAVECLNAHGASLRPGAKRWQRNGIAAVMELRRRAEKTREAVVVDA